MKGCLSTVGLGTVLVVLIAALSSSGSSSTPTKTGPEPKQTTTPAAKPSGNKSCGQTLANMHTSCPFAEAVYAAYSAAVEAQHSPPEHVNAHSAITGRWYTLSCSVQNAVVHCSEGDTAIRFGYPEERASSEGVDEVGSSSHATDQAFCEEHHCIGNFTAEEGTVVECSDGAYSHAGGISGSCSGHGGEREG